MKALNLSSIHQVVLLSEDHWLMLVLLEEKLFVIHMEVGEVMEEVLSVEKTQAKLIEVELMLQDGLLKVWLVMDIVKESSFKSVMESV